MIIAELSTVTRTRRLRPSSPSPSAKASTRNNNKNKNHNSHHEKSPIPNMFFFALFHHTVLYDYTELPINQLKFVASPLTYFHCSITD